MIHKPLMGFLLILIAGICRGQSTLHPGDLAIVEYNSDNPDEFSFVILSPVDSGTVVHFTDRGWDSSGTFRSGEGTLSWEAGTDFQCGAVVHIDSVYGMVLSASGDQILAYQGADSSPVFITALNNEDQGVWQSTASSTAGSALPPGLTNGINAVALLEVDNVGYAGITSGNLNLLKNELFDSSNYTGNNSTPVQFTAGFSISGACILPVHLIRFNLVENAEGVALVWQTASEENNRGFEVQWSEDGQDFSVIGFVEGAGNSTSIHTYRFVPGSINGLVYFRLKQVDFNGNFEYSPILVAKGDEVHNAAKLKSGMLVLSVLSPSEIMIYDLQGRLIQNFRLDGEKHISLDDLSTNGIIVLVRDSQRTGMYERYVFPYLLTSK